MAMKLPTRPTQGPMRGLPLTTGSLPAAAFLILASPDGDSASPARSGTTLERSRIWPSASRIPGFSRPGGPKRNSFMTISSILLCQVGRWMARDHASDAGSGASALKDGACSYRRAGGNFAGTCAGSKRSRERAAIEQQILPRDVAGVNRAQERAGRAEFVRLAEALAGTLATRSAVAWSTGMLRFLAVASKFERSRSVSK